MVSEELKALVLKLRDKDPDVRRKALRDIAKLGDIQAIPALVKLYKGDPDPDVRAEAERALARFKAMDENAVAKEIAPDEGLIVVRNALAALLVVLVVVNVALLVLVDRGDEDEYTGPRDATERDVLIANFTQSLDTLEISSNALLEELAKEPLIEENPDCDREIERPNAVSLNQFDVYTYPDIANVVGDGSRYRTVIQGFNIYYRQWREDCGRMDVQTSLQLSSDITANVLDPIPNLRNTVQTLVNNPVPTNDPDNFGQPTQPATAAPTSTPTLTPTATPTPLPDINYQTHVEALMAILDRSEPGLERIENFWRDAQNNIQVLNCRVPDLDQPYTLPPDQQGDENLDAAAEAIREGLALANENFALFAEYCARQQLSEVVGEGLPQIGQARLRFEEARVLLDVPRSYYTAEEAATPTPSAE